LAEGISISFILFSCSLLNNSKADCKFITDGIVKFEIKTLLNAGNLSNKNSFNVSSKP
jgi:hypothetical protein